MAKTNAIVASGLKFGDRMKYLGDDNYDCIVFDCMEEIVADLSNSITSFPVESGVNITDHIYKEQDKYTLSGWVTNTPNIKYLNQIKYDTANRVGYAVDVLKRLKESKEYFTLITEHEIIENCLISNLTYKNSSGESEMMMFSVAIVRVEIVEYSTTVVAAKVKSVSSGAGKNAKTDAKEKDAHGATTKDEKKSLYDEGKEWVDTKGKQASAGTKKLGSLVNSFF